MSNFKKKRQVHRFKVVGGGSHRRLDQWICEQSSELSRTLIRKVIDLGGVHLNGRRVRKCSQALQAGDNIEIFIDQQSLQPFRLEKQHILYRDSYLLAVNKPSGVETQPTPARFKGTLYEALLNYLKDPYRPQDKPELGMVQRLDRETSGVMVFSIHHRAHKALTELFQGRVIEKKYIALVHGRVDVDKGSFKSLLARQRRTNLMKSVERGGKEAITHYRVLDCFDDCSLVEVVIPTGRMHQIRVHFSEAGYPLVGDVRYGGSDMLGTYAVKRTMLHSAVIMCDHPVTGQPLTLKAPLADDFERILLALGWENNDLLSEY